MSELFTVVSSAEFEPLDFHDEQHFGFSVRLAFDFPEDIENELMTERLSLHDVLSDLLSCPPEFRLFFLPNGNPGHHSSSVFLRPIKGATGKVLLGSGSWQGLEQFSGYLTEMSLLSSGYFGALPGFLNTTNDSFDETLSEKQLGAVHNMQNAATWAAPIPHQIGLTYVVLFKKELFYEVLLQDHSVEVYECERFYDCVRRQVLQVAREYGEHPYTRIDKLISECAGHEFSTCLDELRGLLPPSFDSCDAFRQAFFGRFAILPFVGGAHVPDEEHTDWDFSGHTANAKPCEYPVPLELKDSLIEMNCGLLGGNKYTVRTTTLKFFSDDATSLVDFRSGYIKNLPANAREVTQVLRQAEYHVGEAFWAFPHLLGLGFQEQRGSAGGKPDVWQFVKYLVRQCTGGTVTLLDPLIVSLVMPGVADSDGPLLPEFVSILEKRLHNEELKLERDATTLVLSFLTTGIKALSPPTPLKDRAGYVETLLLLVGDTGPLIQRLLSIYSDSRDPLDDGHQGKLRKEIVSELFRDFSERTEALREQLNAELWETAHRLREETGIERATLRLMESTLLAESSTNGSFVKALLTSVTPVPNGTSKKTPPKETDIRELCRGAFRDYRRLLSDSFNGTEAVRQANNVVYSQLLDAQGVPTKDKLHERIEGALKTYIELRLSQRARNPNTASDHIVQALPALPRTYETNDLPDEFSSGIDPLLEDPAKKQFVPDQSPTPLSIQIAVDESIADADEFANLYNGVGLIVRRSRVNEGQPSERWAYANLARLTVPKGSSGKEEVIQPAIVPLQPAVVDGRRKLALEFDGLPFTSDAFDETLPIETEDSKSAADPFYKVAYPDDSFFGTDQETQFAKLPPLAYGVKYELVAFVVSKGGTLPKALQASDSAPWIPTGLINPRPELHPDIVQEFAYSRRTAIGRTIIEETGPGASRIGSTIERVRPLFLDYPRIGFSCGDDHTSFVDLFRSHDGTGEIALPTTLDNPRVSLTLRDVYWWGASGTLRLQVHQSANPDFSENAASIDIDIPDVEGVLSTLTIDLTYQESRGVVVQASGGTRNVELDENGASGHIWFRLTAPSPCENSIAVSLADPAGEAAGASAPPAQNSDDLLLIAPESNACNCWVKDATTRLEAKVTYPRVGYIDFDRWLSNASLFGATAGGNRDALESARIALLALYIGRTEDQEVAEALERLPDLAVEKYLVELTPIDGLRDAPSDMVKPCSPKLRVIDAPKLIDIVADYAKESPTPDPKGLLDRISEAYTAKLTVIGVEDTLSLALKTDRDPAISSLWRIETQVPAGLTAKVTIRPLIPESHFRIEFGRTAPAIDERMKQLAVGSISADSVDYVVFEGASLVVEGMLGPLAVGTKDTDQAWQSELNEATSEWATVAQQLVKCRPAAAARSYDLVVDTHSVAANPSGWKWRQLGTAEVLTQQWRFSGRPIYNWFNPKSVQQAERSAARRVNHKDHGSRLRRFEEEAFVDRDDLDGERESVIIDPLPPDALLHSVRWEQPSAMFFRHRISVTSRYAGALNTSAIKTVATWGSPEDEVMNDIETWLRVVILADRTRLQLTRPQLRALIPLTTGVGTNIASQTPSVLATLQERPFEHGGLADRICGQIKTGVGYGFPSPDPKEQDGSAPDAAGPATGVQKERLPVRAADVRKEVGPDPRLTYVPTKAEEARGMVLLGEGPVGLTFDRSDAPAPAFANALYTFHPRTLLHEDQSGPTVLEEHFIGVNFLRFLDHRWTVDDPEPPTSQTEGELPAGTPWWVEFSGNGCLQYRELHVCWLEQDDARGTWVVRINSKAIDSESPDTSSNKTDALILCEALVSLSPRIAVLHRPLEEGRAELAVFSLPLEYVQTDSGGADVGIGVSTLPILLASIHWSVPGTHEQGAADSKPMNTITVTGDISHVPVAASPSTSVSWTRTNRNFDSLHVADSALQTEAIDAARLIGRQRADDIVFTSENHPNQPLWLVPKALCVSHPVHVHRHLAVILTRETGGLGEPIEVFEQALRIRGSVLTLPELKPIDGTVGAQADPSRFARVVEFETPSKILVYAPHHSDDEYFREYKRAVFDLRSIVSADRIDRVGALSLFVRFVGSLDTKRRLNSIRFDLYPGLARETQTSNTWREYEISEAQELGRTESQDPHRHPFAVFLRIEQSPGNGTAINASWKLTDSCQVIFSDGTVMTSNAISPTGSENNGGAQILPDGFSLSMSAAMKDGSGGAIELWSDVSLLTLERAVRSSTASREQEFSFSWLFTGNDDLPPDWRVSESGLRSLVEAQARIVAVSPPIRIEPVPGET